MDQSLSVVLPAYNAERTLGRQISDLLEVLPDLAPRFEILVVNDASLDATEDVIRDWATTFPQIRVIHHAVHQGAEVALQTGVQNARGDVIFVQESEIVSPADLRRLWELRNDNQVVMACPEPELPETKMDSSLLQRLLSWGALLRRTARRYSGRGGVQMIRRRGIDVAAHQSDQELAIHRVNQTPSAPNRTVRRVPRFVADVHEQATPP